MRCQLSDADFADAGIATGDERHLASQIRHVVRAPSIGLSHGCSLQITRESGEKEEEKEEERVAGRNEFGNEADCMLTTCRACIYTCDLARTLALEPRLTDWRDADTVTTDATTTDATSQAHIRGEASDVGITIVSNTA